MIFNCFNDSSFDCLARVGEACADTPGCGSLDVSSLLKTSGQTTEECPSGGGTCACASGSEMITLTYSGTTYKICQGR